MRFPWPIQGNFVPLHHKTRNKENKNMNMVEKEKDLIGFAHKVISFRMNVIKACKAKGIDAPTDEQISAYINDYGLHLDDFMADYIEHEGMFRDPINDFIKQVNDLNWANTPTEDVIREFASKHECNIDDFVRWYNIRSITNPMEKATLISTLSLNDRLLVSLWNEFIHESAKYGEDSYIYDLRDETDRNFINVNFPKDVKAELTRLINDYKIHGKELRYFQWFSLNNNELHVIDNIENVIVAYWGEIFERILLYPNLYSSLEDETIYKEYFDEVFFPSFLKASGWELNYDDCTAKLK